MYKEIPLSELKVGMYVVDTNLDWMHHPFLYSNEGHIHSQRDLDEIRAQGFQSAFVDTDRDFLDLDDESDEFNDMLLSRPVETPEEVPFEREVEAAREIYRDSIKYARGFMREARTSNQVDCDQAAVLVEDMIDSLSRNSDALVSLGKLKSYDEYTFTHSINVAVIALAFAERLGMSRTELRDVGFAALFHDIGKARIDATVLNKPGRLSEAEFEEIKRHPVQSLELLKGNARISQEILRGVLQHHEKYDGSGYPRGLPGHRIDRLGVIVSLADVYDAVTSKRVYKSAIRPNQALRIMYGMKGTAFDGAYLEQFIKFLGIYPVGTLVRLSNGQHGIVCESPEGRAHRPKVKIAFDANMRPPQYADRGPR